MSKKKNKVYLGMYLTNDNQADILLITAPNDNIAWKTYKESLISNGVAHCNTHLLESDIIKVDRKNEYFQTFNSLKEQYLNSLLERKNTEDKVEE